VGQGIPITVRASRSGVRAFDMRFRTHCTGGQTWVSRWWPADGAPVPFRNRGRDFQVEETTPGTRADGTHSYIESWMIGRRSADGRSVSGQTRLTATFWRGGGRNVCDSGLVRFTVARR
jgi:hypothetical protein